MQKLQRFPGLQSPTLSSTKEISKLRLISISGVSPEAPKRNSQSERAWTLLPMQTILSWDALFSVPTHEAKSMELSKETLALVGSPYLFISTL